MAGRGGGRAGAGGFSPWYNSPGRLSIHPIRGPSMESGLRVHGRQRGATGEGRAAGIGRQRRRQG